MLRMRFVSVISSLILLPIGLSAQTEFGIVDMQSTDLDGNATAQICPGNDYQVQFVVANGQLNAFAVARIVIVDLTDPLNPLNDQVVGNFNNGAGSIVGTPGTPSAPIPVTVSIPGSASPADYAFFVTADSVNVTPGPAISDSIQRTAIANPISSPTLDTSSVVYKNTFRTDSASRLLSYDPLTGPVAGGVDAIPATAVPVPDVRDSTINFCAGDSLLLWNADSLSATAHTWYHNGAIITGPGSGKGRLWVRESGYYTLQAVQANTCSDSAAYIGVGSAAGGVTAGVKGVYFNAYAIDTTLSRSGPGNAVGPATRFCLGDSVVLSAREISSHPQGNYSYQWVANGTDSVSTNFELVVKNPGSYEVYITESIGSFSCSGRSNLVQVIVDSIPSLAFSTGDSIGILPGDSITVTANVTNGLASSFRWFKLPSNTTVSTAADYEVKDPGTYFVQATSASGCQMNDTLYVEDLSRTHLSISSFQTENLDGTFSLQICPGSTHPLEFVVDDGQVNPFAVVDVIITDKNNPVNPINGTIVGSYGNGGIAIAGTTGAPSAPVPVTVTIPDPINSSDYSFYLAVNPAGVFPSPAVSDSTDRTVIPNPISRMVLDTSTATYANTFKTDSLSILLSNVAGLGPVPGGVDVLPPTAFPIPDAADSTVNFCKGDSLYLWNPDSLTANEHIWLLNGVPYPTASVNQGHLWVHESGYYNLITENSNTCEDSVAYIGVGRPGLIGTAGVKGIYFNAYEVDTTLSRVGVGNAVGPPTRFCVGDSLVLSARENSSHPLGSYTYQWVANGTDSISTDFQIVVKQAGAYEVYLTESIGTGFTCAVKSNVVEVILDSLPGAEIGTSAATICYGDTIVVQDTNTYFPSRLYEWYANGQSLLGTFGDTNLIKLDTALLSSIGVHADTMLYMTLVVTDTIGCDSVSAPVVFDFARYPEIALSSGNSVSLCLGDSLQVSAFTVNGVLSSYIWYDLADSSVISTNSNLMVNTAGTYFVEATGPNGCSKTDTLAVTGLAVTANAGIDQAVDSGQVVQLGATGGVSYYWYANSPVYFNNPFDPNAQTLPTMDTTTYYVEVTAANGCVSVDSMQVFINPKVPDPLEPFSDVQNVITPNGDGVNDLLDLSDVMDGDNCELRIFNRWGAFLRNFPSYQNNWDGTDGGGDILPDGTYYYTLRCSSGVEFRIKGAVTILTGNSK